MLHILLRPSLHGGGSHASEPIFLIAALLALLYIFRREIADLFK